MTCRQRGYIAPFASLTVSAVHGIPKKSRISVRLQSSGDGVSLRSRSAIEEPMYMASASLRGLSHHSFAGKATGYPADRPRPRD
jgi:hypothetical protein